MGKGRLQFDPNDPKYHTCCGCHVMIGAKIFASINTAGIISIGFISFMKIVSLLYADNRSAIDATFLYCNLGGSIVSVAILGSFWYGLIREREGWLLPMMTCWILSLVIAAFGLIALFIFTTIAIFQSGEDGMLMIWVSIICCCLFVLEYWFISVVSKAYHYIEQKRLSSKGGITHVQQSEQEYIAVPKENPEP
uniref:DUF7027 domain-containing protein n=1 Tax=Plectus sambesii TaxID=2011161 RepID=A0A914VJ51_9BILA